MAIDYSINPWSVGAVVFDQRPAIAFAQQQQARQQAKDVALEGYFKDLNKNITPTGMRSQDVPGLLQKQKEWQQFYMQNKAAITNPKLDNGDAYTRYMAGYQDQLGLVNESKEAYKQKEQLGKLKFNKDFNYIFDDPNIIKDIERDDLPIGHPDRKPLNVATMATPPKPWGIKENEQYSKYLTQGLPVSETIGKTETLPGFKTRTEVIRDFGNQGRRTIGQRSMSAYDSERALRLRAKHLVDELSNDPVRHQQLNDIFKGLYKKDIETPQEALAAQAIFDEDRKSRSYKEGKDDWGRDMAMRAMKMADAKELIRYKKEIDPNDTQMNNTWIEGYYSNRIDDAKKGKPTTFQDPDNPLTMKVGYEMKIDPIAAKAFERGGHQPETWYVTADNKILPIYYEYQETFDKSGKKTGVSVKKDSSGQPVIDKDYSKPMDLDQAFLTMGYKGQTKKDLGSTMGKTYNKAGTFKVAGKSYSRKQLNDLGYNDKEIQEYLKTGLITQ